MRFLLLAALAIQVTTPGCTTSPSTAAPDRPPSAASTTSGNGHEILGHSVEGRPIVAQVLGEGPTTILVVGGIHGNEPASQPLVAELARVVRMRPELVQGRRLVIVSAVNPDGLAERRRHNARGVDLNRNFPTSNFGRSARHGESPLSEPESRAIDEVMRRYPPDVIISVHQPVACIDYDGPGERIARAMSAECDLPVRRIGPRPGSLGSYGSQVLGVPVITVELPGHATRLETKELWRRYGAMMLAGIR